MKTILLIFMLVPLFFLPLNANCDRELGGCQSGAFMDLETCMTDWANNDSEAQALCWFEVEFDLLVCQIEYEICQEPIY